MRVKTTELAQLPASCQLLVKLSQIMLSKHLDSTLSVCPWIAAGILRYSQAQIEDAARRANAWEFIESFTHGLKTRIGVRKNAVSVLTVLCTSLLAMRSCMLNTGMVLNTRSDRSVECG